MNGVPVPPRFGTESTRLDSDNPCVQSLASRRRLFFQTPSPSDPQSAALSRGDAGVCRWLGHSVSHTVLPEFHLRRSQEIRLSLLVRRDCRGRHDAVGRNTDLLPWLGRLSLKWLPSILL